MRTGAVAAALAVCALAELTACGSSQPTQAERLTCSNVRQFAAQGPDTGGAPTPLDAAKAVAGDTAGFTIPADGWVQVGSTSPSGTILRSSDVEVTAVRLKDNTWAVFEGKSSA